MRNITKYCFLDKIFHDIILPITIVKKEKPFYKLLQEEFKRHKEIIIKRLIDSKIFSENDFNEVEKSFQKAEQLVMSINCFKNGDREKSYSIFCQYINNISPLYTIKLNKRTHLYYYRIRIITDENTIIKTRKDLFHSPYGNSIKNRFDDNNQPCLYLASTLELAWFEMKKPELYYFSAYQMNEEATNNWEVISLLAPNKFFTTTFDQRDFLNYIKQLPLIIACSIVNTTEATNNSLLIPDEYIIPQHLMKWIKSSKEKNNIVGIKYWSNANDIEHLKIDAYNLALPAINIQEDGYSLELRKNLLLTLPKEEIINEKINSTNPDYWITKGCEIENAIFNNNDNNQFHYI